MEDVNEGTIDIDFIYLEHVDSTEGSDQNDYQNIDHVTTIQKTTVETVFCVLSFFYML